VLTHIVLFRVPDPNGDALERYRVHPAHQDVLAVVAEVSDDRVVVDFET
jgi:hypothetical protein